MTTFSPEILAELRFRLKNFQLGNDPQYTDEQLMLYIASLSGDVTAGLPVPTLVATSNIALTGVVTVDGIASNTIGSGYVLATEQTDPAANGPWNPNSSGPWERPSFYNSDATVADTLGKIFGVTIGGVDNAGTKWYQQSGTTILGAKVFVQEEGGSGSGREPIRAVQTAILSSWVYDNAAGTLTAPANGSLGSTWAAMDAVAGPAVGNVDYEVTGGSLTATTACVQSGIYTLADGSGGSKAVLTRRADLDSAADFVDGVAYDVLDGASALHKGTRRQLYTQGSVVLGTTVLDFGQVRDVDYMAIDVTRQPYNLRLDDTDKKAKINRAIKFAYAQYIARGVAQEVRLPGPELVVSLFAVDKTPIFNAPGVRLSGGGCNQTRLLTHSGGGPEIVHGHTGTIPVVTGLNFAADQISDGQSLVLGDSLTGSDQPFLDFSAVRFEADADFSWDVCFATDSFAASSGGFTIGSCRGLLRSRDSFRTLFACSVNGAGTISFSLRLTNPTGTLTASGPGAPPTLSLTIAGSGNATSSTQLLEGQTVMIECTKSGARGTAEFRYSWFDGHSWVWHQTGFPGLTPRDQSVLSAATVVLQSAPIFNSPVTGVDNAPQGTITLNMGAGAYVAGQKWINNPTTTVTSAPGAVLPGTLILNKFYYLCVEYRGATGDLQLWCKERNAPMGAPVASATGLVGVVRDFPFERFVMGAQVNCNQGSGNADSKAIGFVLGSTRMYRVAQRGGTFPGNAPITMSYGAALGTQSLLYFRPNANAGLVNEGAPHYRWDDTVGSYGCLYRNGVGGNVLCQQTEVQQLERGGVSGLEIRHVNSSGALGPRVQGVYVRSMLKAAYRDLSFQGLGDGLYIQDPSYYSKIADIQAEGTKRHDVFIHNAALMTLEGSVVLNGGGYAPFCGMAFSATQCGYMFVGATGAVSGVQWIQAIMEFQSRADFQCLICSEEGTAWAIAGLHLASNNAQPIRVAGQMLANYSAQASPLSWGIDGNPTSNQGLFDIQADVTAAGIVPPPPIAVLDPAFYSDNLQMGVGAKELIRAPIFSTPARMVLPYGAAPSTRGDDLADISVVISPGAQGLVRVMPPATATAPRTITLGVNRSPKSAVALLAGYNQPALGVEVTVNISTSGLYAGGKVCIEGGGEYRIIRILDATHMVLIQSAQPYNAAPGVPVGIGGLMGIEHAITTVTADFTQPAVGSTVTVAVTASGGIEDLNYNNGSLWYIRGMGFYSEATRVDATHVTLTNTGHPQNAALAVVGGNGQLVVYGVPVQEGDTLRVVFAGPQANAVTCVNDGPAAGTKLTASVGMAGTYGFRFSDNNWSLDA